MPESTATLVGVREIADRLGWDPRRVSTYVARGVMPEPIARLAMGQVWRWEDVERTAIDKGWLPRP